MTLTFGKEENIKERRVRERISLKKKNLPQAIVIDRVQINISFFFLAMEICALSSSMFLQYVREYGSPEIPVLGSSKQYLSNFVLDEFCN